MEKDLFVFKIISNLGKLILLLNTFLYFKSYRKKSIAFKIICYYLLSILIIQIWSSYLASYKDSNLFLSHYYFIGQFLFLSFFYLKLEKKKFLKKVIKTVLILVCTSLGIYYINNPKVYFKFNIFEIVLTSLPLVAYSFLFLLKKVDSKDKKYIYISAGLFLYLSCSTLLFITGNVKNSSLNILIWYANILLYLVYQILIFIDWYQNFRKS